MVKMEDAVIAAIGERRALLRQAADIEAELRSYGVTLIDTPHDTTWELRGVAAAKPAAACGPSSILTQEMIGAFAKQAINRDLIDVLMEAISAATMPVVTEEVIGAGTVVGEQLLDVPLREETVVAIYRAMRLVEEIQSSAAPDSGSKSPSVFDPCHRP